MIPNVSICTLENDSRAARIAQKAVTILAFVTIFALMAFLLSGPAFADNADDIAGAIKSGTQKIYNIFTAIVPAITVVCFAVAAMQLFLGGQRDVDAAKKSLLRTLLVICLVYLAPIIINEVGGWFQTFSSQTDGIFN